MLRDWDTTSLYTNFGALPGFSEADGDIGPSLDTNYGAVNGSESWFDVTSYLESVRTTPQNDFGLAILPQTNDGWAIMLNGATNEAIRPRLVVYSDLSPAGLAGDHNGDGKVDAADYVLWRNDPASFGGSPGGYNAWRANFGAPGSGSGASMGSGPAVPEPASASLLLVATFGITFNFRRTRREQSIGSQKGAQP
jgi:hypothetical protein